jgi:hypothetical protein
MQRRKFLIGMGSLAAGGAAAMGTGAFTSATLADRAVTVGVDSDSSSQVGLLAGDDPDIKETSNGKLALDLSGKDGQGVNVDSVYTWGDHDNPTQNYAFALVNNDENNYDTVNFEYVLNDASWLEDNWESYIELTVYRDGWAGKERRFPDPYEPTKTTSANIDSNMIFDSGEVWPVVVDVKTTVDHAEATDDLTGSLSIDVSGPTSSSD